MDEAELRRAVTKLPPRLLLLRFALGPRLAARDALALRGAVRRATPEKPLQRAPRREAGVDQREYVDEGQRVRVLEGEGGFARDAVPGLCEMSARNGGRTEV